MSLGEAEKRLNEPKLVQFSLNELNISSDTCQ